MPNFKVGKPEDNNNDGEGRVIINGLSIYSRPNPKPRK